MTENETTVAAEDATKETGAKEKIHALIDSMVSEKTGKRIGLATAKDIFDTVLLKVFEAAAADGQIRLPGGLGSFHVRHLGAGTKPKRLPSGKTVEIGEGRVKLRYQEGVVIKTLLGTNKKDAPAA